MAQPDMQGLSRAVLDKVRAEADAIVQAAREEAERELERARRRHEARLVAEHQRLKAAAEVEAARIVAHGVMEARGILAGAKAAVIQDVVERARAELAELETEAEALRGLIEDAMEGLGSAGKGRVCVRAADLEPVKELVSGDKALARRVAEVTERPIDGGVIVESEDGAILVDNSHIARLEMLVPRIIVRIARELF